MKDRIGQESKELLTEMPSQHLPSLPRSSAELVVEQELASAQSPAATEPRSLTALSAVSTPRFVQAHRLLARYLLGGLAVALALVAGLGFVQPAQAKSIEIPCWPGITFSLAAAIEEANNTPGHDEIRITRKCTVFEISIKGNYGNGNVGLPLITDDLTIRGKGSIVKRDVNDNERFRLLESAPGVKLHLENLTFDGGETDFGGAVFAGGPLTLTQVMMQNNKASGVFGSGGAVFAKSSLVISASTFLTNTGNWHGGAIFADGQVTVQGRSHFANNSGRFYGGAISTKSDLFVYDTFFEKNKAVSLGGAIFVDKAAYIEHSQFVFNEAGSGGGAIYATGSLSVHDNWLAGNRAGSYGGAVAIDGNSSVVKSRFENNITTGQSNNYQGGGAIFALGELSIAGSKFTKNQSPNVGGAVYVEDLMLIQDSHFEQNKSDQDGGAIYVSASYQIEATTFIGNEGDMGGAVYGDAEGGIVASTFTSNKAFNGGGLYSVAPTIVVSSTFESNEAEMGGGLLVEAEAQIRGTRFLRNSATGDSIGGGGGALIYTGQVYDSSFSRNQSQNDAAGLLAGKGVQITNNMFIGNAAMGHGGGLAAYQIETPSSLIINNLFLDNHAGEGAAVAIGFPAHKESGGVLTLIHNTIVRTSPGGSNAVFINIGSLAIQSNIITNYSVGVAATNSTVTADHNLFFGNNVNYAGVTAGAADLNADPLFVAADDRDFRLTANSPAVDSAAIPGVSVDMDKKARPLGDGYDRGAYEFTPLEAGISELAITHSGPTHLGNATYFSATVAAGDNVNYFWKFGDDTGGEGANVSHTYAATGTYTVAVTARNSVSRTSAVVFIEVLPPADDEPDDNDPGGGNTGGDPDDDPGGDPGDDDPEDDDPNEDPGGNDPGDDDAPPPLVSIYLPLTMR